MAAPEETLEEYLPKYNPPIIDHANTCVGLGMEVMKRLKTLENEFPGISKSLMLVSCEEQILDPKDYTTYSPSPQEFLIETAKDHVLVAIPLKIDGRPGMFLSDLGYHVPRVVTVMHDLLPPHTGWFVQSDELHCRKEYNYQFNMHNKGYIEWHDRETRGDSVKNALSLIFVARAYLSAVEVSEKRNLLYHLKSLLARNSKGGLTAGIYFPLKKKDQQFTMFFESQKSKIKKKYKFATFLDLQKVPEDTLNEVKHCNEQLNLREGELLHVLKKLAVILADEEDMTEILEINEHLEKLSAEN